MTKRISTMEELSTEIGVSRPTLSKYFRDPGVVRKSTRERIANALNRIDYVPNFFARNMNRRRTGLIGVVVPHLNDLFYTTLLQEIEKRAAERKFSIVIQNSHGSVRDEIIAIENIRSMNAEGIIVAPVGRSSNEELFRRVGEELPVIFVDARYPGLSGEFSFVGTDNNQSIRLMVDYLCRSGTPPVFLSMPLVNSNSLEREAAYVRRMRELGHKPNLLTADDHEGDWNFEAYAYRFMSREIAAGKLRDATVLCANDRLAMGVLRAANEAGLFRLGKKTSTEFRVAGHDNHPLSDYFRPSLTTVSQDVSQIGRATVDLAVAQAVDESGARHPPTETLFNAQLILRDSA